MNTAKRAVFYSLLFLALSPSLYASSAYIGVHSVDGLGRSYAGEVSVAETASATSKNPALILSLEGTQIAAGSALVLSRFDATVNKHPFIEANENRGDMQAKNFGPNYLPLPSFHLTVNKGNWGYGLSSSSYHAGLLNYDKTNFGIRELGDDTYIITANLQFDLAFKVTEKLDFGFGIDYGYGKANLERSYGFVADNRFLNLLSPLLDVVGSLQEGNVHFLKNILPNFQSFDSPNSMLLHFRGSASAFGYHLGLNYKLSERFNLGASYRSKMKYKLKGTYYSDLPNLPLVYSYGTDSERRPAFSYLNQAPIAEVGATFKFTPKLHLHGGVFWQQWSDFQELRATDSKTKHVFVVKELKHKDHFRYSVGGAYQLTERFKLRLGFSLDKSAASKKDVSLTFPSSDRYWYSAGFNYQLSSVSSIDVGFAYAKNKKATAREVGLVVKAIDGLPDKMTVNELIRYLEVKLPITLPKNIGEREVDLNNILKPEIYDDLESETEISAKLMFFGLQYNRRF